jgi:hypothetical protein
MISDLRFEKEDFGIWMADGIIGDREAAEEELMKQVWHDRLKAISRLRRCEADRPAMSGSFLIILKGKRAGGRGSPPDHQHKL